MRRNALPSENLAADFESEWVVLATYGGLRWWEKGRLLASLPKQKPAREWQKKWGIGKAPLQQELFYRRRSPLGSHGVV